MDDAPYTGDLNVDAVSTRDELASLLRTVHVRADKPSLRTLEARTRRGVTPLSKTAVAEMLKGVRFPRKAVMIAFLQVCGLHDDDMDSWLRVWEKVAAREERLATSMTALIEPPSPLAAGGAESDAPADGLGGDQRTDEQTASADRVEVIKLREQIDQLASDNEKLRSQLSVPRPQAAEAPRPGETASAREARSPLVSRRELGALLRALRLRKGIAVEQVAEHLMCSSTKVRRMETNFRSGTARDVRDLCDLYEVTDTTQRDHLMELARQSKQQGWWQSYNLPFSSFVGLEADAASILSYGSVIPGLLQTAEYVRAMHECFMPGVEPEVVERRIEARLKRQHRLTEADPPKLWFILDESALHRMVGGAVVIRNQLSRLVEVSMLPNVTVQVIPYEVGAHPGIDSSFSILEFAAPMDSVVYVEGLVGFFYIDNRKEVDRYDQIFKQLSAMARNLDKFVN